MFSLSRFSVKTIPNFSGSGAVERVIKENHKSWYEDESWEALNLPYECFQKILKGKVHKAMNGAIAGKYSNWPGVKEFVQKHTYGSNGHCIKFNDLYRYIYNRCQGLKRLKDYFVCFHHQLFFS